LIQYTRRQLDFFREVSKHDEYWRDGLNFSHYGLPRINCLLTLYYNDDRLFCVMPKEIKEAFRELEQTSFPKEWERCELLRAYANATTELYGVIRVSDFIEIFNKQNTEPTTESELLEAISVESDPSPIIIEEDYLFREICFDDAEWEEIEDVVFEADKKPRFIPTTEEMLIYGEPGYSPDTPQRIEAENYLISVGIKEVEASDLMSEIEDMFQSKRWKMDDLSRITNEITTKMKMEQVKKFMHLLMEMSNNTRSWFNAGYSPNELRTLMRKEPVNLSTSPIRIIKVGRNEPCPCGSGRKHKHCCWR
ncbi:MAG: SEC-C domain-containing protein, partial [Defluviitaleaceae bacterium]|nr:SEC-C domain-containing protein [Defluviitaleaceae bacterium]